MMTLIRDQQATIAAQQVEIAALKQFVGMMPPSEAGVKAASERRDARIRFLCRNAKASLAFALD